MSFFFSKKKMKILYIITEIYVSLKKNDVFVYGYFIVYQSKHMNM